MQSLMFVFKVCSCVFLWTVDRPVARVCLIFCVYGMRWICVHNVLSVWPGRCWLTHTHTPHKLKKATATKTRNQTGKHTRTNKQTCVGRYMDAHPMHAARRGWVCLHCHVRCARLSETHWRSDGWVWWRAVTPSLRCCCNGACQQPILTNKCMPSPKPSTNQATNMQKELTHTPGHQPTTIRGLHAGHRPTGPNLNCILLIY